MRALIILSLCLLPLIAQAQCDIVSQYGDFITIEKANYKGNDYLTKKAIATPEGHCLSSLIDINLTYINYLITNFSDNQNYGQLLAISDSVARQAEYIRQLQQDETFNAAMKQLANGTINQGDKETFSTDEILNIAVKYFSIPSLNGDYYSGKICTGINDIKSTEKIRNPQLEAFCFSSIIQSATKPGSELIQEFTSEVRELYKVNLGVNKKERLLRAQGALFMTMRNNTYLRTLLKEEYDRRKEQLPFVWADE